MKGLWHRHRPEQAPLLGVAELAALLAAARTLADVPVGRLSSLAGEVVSNRRGRGSEFEELRPWQPGDERRDMDWRATAKTGRPWIRVNREDRQLNLHLLLDRGPTMRFATQGTLKVTQALRLGLLLGGSAGAMGASVGGSVLGEGAELLSLPTGRDGLMAWLALANQPCPPLASPGGDTLSMPLSTLTESLLLGTNLIWLSDFAGLAESQLPLLVRLAERHQVQALQVLDSVELALPDVGEADFTNLAGATLRINTADAAVRRRYEDEQAARQESIAGMLSRCGIPLRRFLTTDDPLTVLVDV